MNEDLRFRVYFDSDEAFKQSERLIAQVKALEEELNRLKTKKVPSPIPAGADENVKRINQNFQELNRSINAFAVRSGRTLDPVVAKFGAMSPEVNKATNALRELAKQRDYLGQRSKLLAEAENVLGKNTLSYQRIADSTASSISNLHAKVANRTPFRAMSADVSRVSGLLSRIHPQLGSILDVLGDLEYLANPFKNAIIAPSLDTGGLQTARQGLVANITKTTQAQAATSSLSNATNLLGNAFKAINPAILGTVATIGSLTVAFKIGKDAVDAFGRSDDVLRQYQAVAKLTENELSGLRVELTKINSAFPEFDMRETTEGMVQLARAGLNTRDALDLLPASMNLAIAAGDEFATTNERMLAIMNQFQIPFSQASEVSDQLSAATNAANIELTDIADAMKFVGPVSKAFNQDLTEVLTGIGMLGNVGIKGEMAGTALRNMFLRLISPVGRTSEALGELKGQIPDDEFNDLVSEMGKAHKSISSLGFSISDENGNIKKLSTILEELRDKTKGYNDATRLKLLTDIAGARASSSLLALLKLSDEEFQSLTTSIKDSEGETRKMVDTMRKSLPNVLKGVSNQQSILQERIGGSIVSFSKLSTSLISLSDLFGKFTKEGKGDEIGRNLGRGLGAILPLVNPIVNGGMQITRMLGMATAGLSPLIRLISELIAGGLNVLLWTLDKGLNAAQPFIESMGILGSTLELAFHPFKTLDTQALDNVTERFGVLSSDVKTFADETGISISQVYDYLEERSAAGSQNASQDMKNLKDSIVNETLTEISEKTGQTVEDLKVKFNESGLSIKEFQELNSNTLLNSLETGTNNFLTYLTGAVNNWRASFNFLINGVQVAYFSMLSSLLQGTQSLLDKINGIFGTKFGEGMGLAARGILAQNSAQLAQTKVQASQVAMFTTGERVRASSKKGFFGIPKNTLDAKPDNPLGDKSLNDEKEKTKEAEKQAKLEKEKLEKTKEQTKEAKEQLELSREKIALDEKELELNKEISDNQYKIKESKLEESRIQRNLSKQTEEIAHEKKLIDLALSKKQISETQAFAMKKELDLKQNQAEKDAALLMLEEKKKQVTLEKKNAEVEIQKIANKEAEKKQTILSIEKQIKDLSSTPIDQGTDKREEVNKKVLELVKTLGEEHFNLKELQEQLNQKKKEQGLIDQENTNNLADQADEIKRTFEDKTVEINAQLAPEAGGGGGGGENIFGDVLKDLGGAVKTIFQNGGKDAGKTLLETVKGIGGKLFDKSLDKLISGISGMGGGGEGGGGIFGAFKSMLGDGVYELKNSFSGLSDSCNKAGGGVSGFLGSLVQGGAGLMGALGGVFSTVAPMALGLVTSFLGGEGGLFGSDENKDEEKIKEVQEKLQKLSDETTAYIERSDRRIEEKLTSVRDSISYLERQTAALGAGTTQLEFDNLFKESNVLIQKTTNNFTFVVNKLNKQQDRVLAAAQESLKLAEDVPEEAADAAEEAAKGFFEQLGELKRNFPKRVKEAYEDLVNAFRSSGTILFNAYNSLSETIDESNSVLAEKISLGNEISYAAIDKSTESLIDSFNERYEQFNQQITTLEDQTDIAVEAATARLDAKIAKVQEKISEKGESKRLLRRLDRLNEKKNKIATDLEKEGEIAELELQKQQEEMKEKLNEQILQNASLINDSILSIAKMYEEGFQDTVETLEESKEDLEQEIARQNDRLSDKSLIDSSKIVELNNELITTLNGQIETIQSVSSKKLRDANNSLQQLADQYKKDSERAGSDEILRGRIENQYESSKQALEEIIKSITDTSSQQIDTIRNELYDVNKVIEEQFENQKELIESFSDRLSDTRLEASFGDLFSGIISAIRSFEEDAGELLASGFNPEDVGEIIGFEKQKLEEDIKQRRETLLDEISEGKEAIKASWDEQNETVKDAKEKLEDAVNALDEQFKSSILGLNQEAYDIISEGRITGARQKTDREKLAEITAKVKKAIEERNKASAQAILERDSKISEAKTEGEKIRAELNEKLAGLLKQEAGSLLAVSELTDKIDSTLMSLSDKFNNQKVAFDMNISFDNTVIKRQVEEAIEKALRLNSTDAIFNGL
jgi:TP901 family phage tail tape measure protein